MKKIKTIPFTAIFFLFSSFRLWNAQAEYFQVWEMIRFLSEHFQKYKTIITFV